MNTTFKNIGLNNIVLWSCNSSKSIKLIIELSEVKNMSTFALKTLKIHSSLVLEIHAIPFASLIYAREAGKVVTVELNREIYSRVQFSLTLRAYLIHFIIL